MNHLEVFNAIETEGSTTVTVVNATHQRRIRVLELAEEIGNVSEACRLIGVSRTRYYEWKAIAEQHGLDALQPRERRRPSQPNETPTWQVEIIIAEAVSRATLGPAQLLPFLEERGVCLSASGVYKVLARNGLGTRRRRVAALATITAASGGPVTREAMEGPFGFCHFAARPGDLVALDSFYVGKLNGVGKVWMFTAIDTATRLAVVHLLAGEHTAEAAAAFLQLLRTRLATHRIPLTRVLTDRGPEFVGKAFTRQCAAMGIEHVRTPPRSPNHNAVCERFHSTVLHEFFRTAFHRQYFTSVRRLDRQLQTWVEDHYNTQRRNHGDVMRGRTPAEVLQTHHDWLVAQ